MSVPGSNLLATALSVLGVQTVQHFRILGRTTNEIGLDVAEFAAPENVRGSFQPVPLTLIQQLGLDLNKSYVNFYSITPVFGIERNSAGDQLVFAGKRYQVLSPNDWQAVDGWQSVLCVEIQEE